MFYETEEMPSGAIDRFISWFKDEIGTDIELNRGDQIGDWYAICCDLTKSEIDKCRKFENSLNKKY